MKELKETIIEAREELMVSLTGDANPTRRTAHFLKPTIPSIAKNIPKNPLLSKFSSLPSTFEPSEWPLSIKFHGWRGPQKKWKEWVEKMAALHESTWKNAGIYQAVLSSTYRIQRNNGLVLGVAERWYPKTNTFVFPWGEATITLEDMLFVGYSVLGSPVFSPLETDDFEELEQKLVEVMTILRKTKAKKADHSTWIGYFLGNKSEFEHEAFLSLWLSRFVFPSHSYGMISKNVFPIAIHLARGIKVALAPALLASIYRDLSLLKGKILALEANDDRKLEVTIWSPFQIVQVWVWERFPKLQPKPNLRDSEAPRLARWHNVSNLLLRNVRSALESGARFQWLPYSTSMDSLCYQLYDEKEKLVSGGGDFDEELESFARFVRACELVGIGCIELCCPHRVAMQFGVDQDLPAPLKKSKATQEILWRSYDRPIKDAMIYVPSRHSKTNVTLRYLEWWKQSMLSGKDASGSPMSSKTWLQSPEGKDIDHDASCPPGFNPIRICIEVLDSDEEDDLTVKELLTCNGKRKIGEAGIDGDCKLSSAIAQGLSPSAEDSDDVIVTNPKENNIENEPRSGKERTITMEDTSKTRVEDSPSPVQNAGSLKDKAPRSRSSFDIQTDVLALEARIMKLRKEVDGLKAARFGQS